MKHAYGDVTYATAAEVSRNFGRWQDQALAGPVVVTHHGRPRVAVISAQHFEALTEPDAAGGLAEDSPDTARLQDALAALQAFRSATAGGSVRLTRRGVVAAIDEAAAHLLGLTVEQATGATLNDLIDGDERRRVSVALEDCFEAGVACQLDLAHAGGNGGRSPVTLGIAPVLRNGLVDGVAVAVTPKTTPGARDG